MAGELRAVPLEPATWPAFAGLVERDGGVWGGCWCMAFHPEGVGRGTGGAAGHRAAKEARVRTGTTHAALVLDGEECLGWCQFGPPAELPRIKRRREHEAAALPPADWRITCLYVGRAARRRGVAHVALRGALVEIGRLGGGRVESYPEDTTGRRTSSSFLHNGTLALFEAHGFRRVRGLGKHHAVVVRDV